MAAPDFFIQMVGYLVVLTGVFRFLGALGGAIRRGRTTTKETT